jgi:hypothetical protein
MPLDPTARHAAAVHECGHGVLCCLLWPDRRTVQRVTLGGVDRGSGPPAGEVVFSRPPNATAEDLALMLAGGIAAMREAGRGWPGADAVDRREASSVLGAPIDDARWEGLIARARDLLRPYWPTLLRAAAALAEHSEISLTPSTACSGRR